MLTRLFVGLLAAGALVLGNAIVVALGAESIFVAGPRIAQDPWAWVTIVDLYLGFLVFGGYVAVREGRAVRALPWLAAIFCLGNLASAAYVGWVLARHRFDPRALLRPAAQTGRLDVEIAL